MARRSAWAGGDDHLAVKPPRPQQGRVQGLGPVGGRHHHHPGGRIEPVHLGQHLVQGLIPLIIGHQLAPRRWPMASISSMNTIEGARLRASANRSRTRAAPTPTNISTNWSR